MAHSHHAHGDMLKDFGIGHATLELELPATTRDHDTSVVPDAL